MRICCAATVAANNKPKATNTDKHRQMKKMHEHLLKHLVRAQVLVKTLTLCSAALSLQTTYTTPTPPKIASQLLRYNFEIVAQSLRNSCKTLCDLCEITAQSLRN
jgi:hypothetical protein